MGRDPKRFAIPSQEAIPEGIPYIRHMGLSSSVRHILRIGFFLASLATCAAVDASDLALVGAKIFAAPEEPPIENGTILIHDGLIATVGPAAKVQISRDATVLDCKGLVVTAGFWNSHVHILSPALLHADTLSSPQLAAQLEEMFTRWGFTTVFDIASVLDNTKRI